MAPCKNYMVRVHKWGDIETKSVAATMKKEEFVLVVKNAMPCSERIDPKAMK